MLYNVHFKYIYIYVCVEVVCTNLLDVRLDVLTWGRQVMALLKYCRVGRSAKKKNSKTTWNCTIPHGIAHHDVSCSCPNLFRPTASKNPTAYARAVRLSALSRRPRRRTGSQPSSAGSALITLDAHRRGLGADSALSAARLSTRWRKD